MPFADEIFAHRVEVLPYQDRWADEGADVVRRLWRLMPHAAGVDHIGSTSVPRMPAKDCLDAMVRVPSLDGTDVGPLLASGFRERPEEWNRSETLDGRASPKRVFAPPVGGRPVNVHVREAGSATARYALLFRDFLRADTASCDTWGQFKTRLARTVSDVYSYGQMKASVQPLLMAHAEEWAQEHSWQP